MPKTWSIADALDVPLGDRDVMVWWLGQAGFLLRSAGGSLLIDPYLVPRDVRRFAPPFLAAEAAGVDGVLVTHEHGDHLDVDTVRVLAAAGTTASWMVPEPVAGQLAALGVAEPRILTAQPGQRHEIGRISVWPVAACHGVHVADAYATGEDISGGLVRFLGYVVEMGGTRFYHSGDCLVYPGLAEELSLLGVDVVLLPINGRDAEREANDIVGNMSADEAVDLAITSGAEVLIPMHWDLFENNRGYPNEVVKLAEQNHPDLTVLLPSRERPIGLHSLARR